MRTLAFDGRTGVAGDMICAALVAAGADPAVLAPVEERLPVRYAVGETVKNGIRSTTVDVLLTRDESDDDRDRHHLGDDHDHHSHDHHAHGDDHSHDHHAHGDDHSHDHHAHGDDHSHDHHDADEPGRHTHAEGAGVHRSYTAVVDVVESLALDPAVESVALDAFELLGRAEASVHGTDLDDTHFHEVGADDAIADIVGAALLLDDLDVDRVVTTPLATGGGQVEMSHGVYPVPAPAVVEIAGRTDLSLVGGPVDRELCTPTGAAILGAVAEGVDRLPALDVVDVGYGAGRLTLLSHPNVLRALVGHEVSNSTASKPVETSGPDGTGLRFDEIIVLETTLDDATPEVLGGLHERLADVGARDVTLTPTTMKKSRPGHLVTVICKPADVPAVTERLARETGTLGIRQSGASFRWIADRVFETVTLDIDGESFEVRVKIASTVDGDVYDVSAEYDDAAAVAAEADLPIREVLRRAEAAVDP